MKLRYIAALLLLTASCAAQTYVLEIGNSDAAVNSRQLAQDEPQLTIVTRSYYSNTCTMIARFLPQVLASIQAQYGPPAAIINWQGQCDVEQGHSPVTVLTCEQWTMAQESALWPTVPQIWPNVAPEPQYSLLPPSGYPGNIWAAVVVYNVATGQGIAGRSSLAQYANALGVPYLSVDAWTILHSGWWGNPSYFDVPSVDPNAAGEAALDTQGIIPALQQIGVVR